MQKAFHTVNPRLSLLIRILGSLYLKEQLRQHLGIPNRMRFTRWLQGKAAPSETEVKVTVEFAAEYIPDLGSRSGATPTRQQIFEWFETANPETEAELSKFLDTSPLRELRESHGLSQAQAAKLLGVARATLIKYEQTYKLAEGEIYERARRVYGQVSLSERQIA